MKETAHICKIMASNCDNVECNNEGPHRCGRCLKAFYCSEACQRACWVGHRAECKKEEEANNEYAKNFADYIARGADVVIESAKTPWFASPDPAINELLRRQRNATHVIQERVLLMYPKLCELGHETGCCKTLHTPKEQYMNLCSDFIEGVSGSCPSPGYRDELIIDALKSVGLEPACGPREEASAVPLGRMWVSGLLAQVHGELLSRQSTTSFCPVVHLLMVVFPLVTTKKEFDYLYEEPKD